MKRLISAENEQLGFLLGLFSNSHLVWEEKSLKKLKTLTPSFPVDFLKSFRLFITLSERSIEAASQYKLRSVMNGLRIQMNQNLLWELIKLAHGATEDFPALASCFQTKS